MPLGLLCSSGSKNEDDGRICRTHVELLDKTVLHLDLPKNATGAGCLEIVGEKLGLTEITYFGLQYVNKKGSEWWLELDKPVSKQLQRHSNGYFDATLKFQVHFFVSDVFSLQSAVTRHLYYLQLKSNVLQSRLACTEEAAIVLASYIAQAELGDYVDDRSFSNIRNLDLLPESLMLSKSRDEVYLEIFDLYKSHSGLSAIDAEMEFVKLTQQLEGYGDEYYPAKDKEGLLILIGATFRGIVIRHSHGLPPVCFKWPDIIRITYSKRYFCIETTKTLDTIQFLMEDNATAKYVWKMFVGHHRFRRLNVTETPRAFEKHRWSRKMTPDRKVTLNSAYSSESVNVATNQVLEASPENSESVSDEQIHATQNDNFAYTPESGIINPLFEDDADNTHSIDSNVILNSDDKVVMRNSPQSAKKVSRPISSVLPDISSKQSPPSPQDRPKSVDLSEITDTSIKGRSKSPEKLSMHGVGSSLSVDSGHPPPYSSCEFFNYGQSLDSLVEGGNNSEMMQERPSKHAQRAASSIGFAENRNFERPARPTSLNLEGIGGSWKARHTSGYFSSSDSDFSDDLCDDDEKLTRNDQLQELEKNLNEGQMFTEFQKIKRRSENLSVSTGSLPVNDTRNRFNDILPYEDNRVLLSPRNNATNNNYINASHIKIEIGHGLYKYIAAQGPTNDTLQDFWQMIWEQNVRLLVMATEEKVTRETNCMRYWPEHIGEEQNYGQCHVIIEDLRDCSPYKIRRMKLRHSPSKQVRTLYHVQFTDWPDHKIPDDPTNFLEFLDQMESLRQLTNSSLSHGEERSPVLVHCTAGVGRTGVIILTDLMIACVQNDQRINIHKTLVRLRRQRMQLVANFGQYRFVYTAVIHYLKNSRLI